MKLWHGILVVGVFALLMLFYKGLWGDPRAIPTVLVGTQAPSFSGPELPGNQPVLSDQFKGKVVMLNFWASWCLECRDEHPNLLEIQKRFGPHPDFVMIGIDYQDREEDALNYLKVYGNNFRHIRDPRGAISIDYGVYGVPETFVIDRQGIIRFKQVGPLVGPVYTHFTEKVLAPLLQGQSSPKL